MIFLYDTGARIQEALDVKICDLRIDKTPAVTLHGKGGKIRVVPLMKDTVQHLDNYMVYFIKEKVSFQRNGFLCRAKRFPQRNV